MLVVLTIGVVLRTFKIWSLPVFLDLTPTDTVHASEVQLL